jgi:hypothetical protein
VRRKRIAWTPSAATESTSFTYADGVAHLADAMTFAWPSSCDVLVFDPPWDNQSAWKMELPAFRNALVFCDGKYASTAIGRFGAPWWIFVWDTMQTWSSTKSRPLNGCKFCLLYGSSWNRDAALYGEAPPAKNHPSTSYVPADGRRLSDLYRKSLRWQSNSNASGRSDRPPHTKPDEWVSALVAGVAVTGGLVVDPFMGGGSSVLAANAAGMRCVATEIDRDVFSWARQRLLHQPGDDRVLPLFVESA